MLLHTQRSMVPCWTNAVATKEPRQSPRLVTNTGSVQPSCRSAGDAEAPDIHTKHAQALSQLKLAQQQLSQQSKDMKLLKQEVQLLRCAGFDLLRKALPGWASLSCSAHVHLQKAAGCQTAARHAGQWHADDSSTPRRMSQIPLRCALQILILPLLSIVTGWRVSVVTERHKDFVSSLSQRSKGLCVLVVTERHRAFVC